MTKHTEKTIRTLNANTIKTLKGGLDKVHKTMCDNIQFALEKYNPEHDKAAEYRAVILGEYLKDIRPYVAMPKIGKWLNVYATFITLHKDGTLGIKKDSYQSWDYETALNNPFYKMERKGSEQPTIDEAKALAMLAGLYKKLAKSSDAGVQKLAKRLQSVDRSLSAIQLKAQEVTA